MAGKKIDKKKDGLKAKPQKKSNTSTKKKGKKNKKKKKSIFSFLFKLIFISSLLGGLSYSVFFVKVDGKTAYTRIIKMLNQKNKTNKKPNKKILTKTSLDNKKIKTTNKVNKISKVKEKRQNQILKAKTRDRNIEKIIVRKKQIDFIGKKSISKKEKESLNNIINSNL